MKLSFSHIFIIAALAIVLPLPGLFVSNEAADSVFESKVTLSLPVAQAFFGFDSWSDVFDGGGPGASASDNSGNSGNSGSSESYVPSTPIETSISPGVHARASDRALANQVANNLINSGRLGSDQAVVVYSDIHGAGNTGANFTVHVVTLDNSSDSSDNSSPFFHPAPGTPFFNPAPGPPPGGWPAPPGTPSNELPPDGGWQAPPPGGWPAVPESPITFTATPTLVRPGTTVMVTWDPGVNPNCNLRPATWFEGSNPNVANTGYDLVITNQTTITYTCGSRSESITIRVLPTLFET